jgi:hypothetical protein
MADQQDPAWHQALVFAVTGQRLTGLGRQGQPDLAEVARIVGEQVDLSRPLGPPRVVPPELMAGIGPAQFLAALTQLRRELSSDPVPTSVVANRPLTADERRLLTDVPPHHGS